MLPNKLTKRKNHKNEEGFTLIELMIVIVIIGILAAIAILLFMNQQKAAIDSTIKSDVKNTVTNIMTGLTKQPTANIIGGGLTPTNYTQNTPIPVGTNTINSVISSPETKLAIWGTWDDYKVQGVNTASDGCYMFISTTGKYGECSELEQPVAVPEEPEIPVIACDLAGGEDACAIRTEVDRLGAIAYNYTNTCTPGTETTLTELGLIVNPKFIGSIFGDFGGVVPCGVTLIINFNGIDGKTLQGIYMYDAHENKVYANGPDFQTI